MDGLWEYASRSIRVHCILGVLDTVMYNRNSYINRLYYIAEYKRKKKGLDRVTRLARRICTVENKCIRGVRPPEWRLADYAISFGYATLAVIPTDPCLQLAAPIIAIRGPRLRRSVYFGRVKTRFI